MASGGGNHVEHKANVNEKEKPIGDESRRHLFVCKVSNEASKESLTEFFQQYGEVQDVRLIYDKHTRAGCGFGFVSTDFMFVETTRLFEFEIEHCAVQLAI